MTAEILTQRQLNRATLARQMLLQREPVSVVEAVERLCGLQAQEPRPPFIGLWTRLAAFERQALTDELHARRIVRATLLRGTLHLFSAADYQAFRPVLQPVLTAGLKVLGDRATGMEVDRLLPVARAYLKDGPRTFTEIRAALSEAFPEVNERALGFAVRMELPLVMAPTGDRWAFPSVASFTPADDWLGGGGDPGTPADLVLRYLAAFGPATVADAQAWSGLGGLKPVFEALRPRLASFRDERKRELFDLPDAPRPDPDTPAPVRYLPEFDNLVLSHQDRTRVLADAHKGLVVTKNLRVRGTFLWDGFVAGTWTAERKKTTATLQVTPFAPLPAGAEAELTREGEALLRFAESDAATVQVQIGAPVGAA